MKNRAILCSFMLLSAIQAFAQDDAEILEKKFKGENAAMSINTEHLVIRNENGELKANSYVEREVCLLTDIAPRMYNYLNIYHGSFNKLKDIEAATLLPEGKRGYKEIKTKDFRTTRSESDGIFYDDAKQTSVNYTGLVKGAKTHLKYELLHTDIRFIPVFYFQSYLPIARSKFVVTAPKSVKLKYLLRGNNTDLVHFTKEESKNTVTYTWYADDLPRFKTYEDAPEISYYMPHLILYVNTYYDPRVNEDKTVFGKPADLYKYYYEFISDINTVKDANLSATVASVTKGISDPQAKAEAIYKWVQKNIRYVAFEDGMGGFIPREGAAVCKRKYGDCKDMSSLLVMMCREAGLDAHYTWIGTRHIPYTYEEAPLPVADNHMICALKLNGRWIFMDGTDSNIPFGNPPSMIQGKEALIGIDKKNFEIVKIPEIPGTANRVDDSTYLKLSAGALEGSVNISYKGYSAWHLEAMMSYKNENEKEETMKNIASRGSNKYSQKSFDFKIADNLAKDITVKSDFEMKDYARLVGKEWYVNMNLQRSYENDWIDIKDRKVPVEYRYKKRVRQVVALEIPKGYHVSYLPPAVEKNTGDLWGYKISYKNTGKVVQLIKEYALDMLYLQPEQFAGHNKMVEDLKQQYKESIVLTAD